nr:hypothetical protein [Candidatus Sigynarchaeota archaeon]
MDEMTFILKTCTNAVSILVACELAFFLLGNQRGKKKQHQPPVINRTYLGLALFFIFHAAGILAYIFEVWFVYFLPPAMLPEIITFMDKITIMFSICAYSGFFIVQGRSLTRIKVDLLVASGMILLFVTIFLPPWIFAVVLACLLPFCALPFVLLYLFIEVTRGKSRLNLGVIFTGFSVLTAGILMMTPTLGFMLDFKNWFVPEPLILLGLAFMAGGFFSGPSLNEVFAPSYIKELYLTTSDGRIILRHQFKKVSQMQDTEQDQMDREVFASSIVGIDKLLHEISSSKGVLKTLVHQDEVLIIEFTSRVVGVLVTHMDLNALRAQLASFLQDADATLSDDILKKESIEIKNKTFLTGRVEFTFRLHVTKLGKVMRKFFTSIDTFFSEIDALQKKSDA